MSCAYTTGDGLKGGATPCGVMDCAAHHPVMLEVLSADLMFCDGMVWGVQRGGGGEGERRQSQSGKERETAALVLFKSVQQHCLLNVVLRWVSSFPSRCPLEPPLCR